VFGGSDDGSATVNLPMMTMPHSALSSDDSDYVGLGSSGGDAHGVHDMATTDDGSYANDETFCDLGRLLSGLSSRGGNARGEDPSEYIGVDGSGGDADGLVDMGDPSDAGHNHFGDTERNESCAALREVSGSYGAAHDAEPNEGAADGTAGTN
jgi:hypothetical protein